MTDNSSVKPIYEKDLIPFYTVPEYDGWNHTGGQKRAADDPSRHNATVSSAVSDASALDSRDAKRRHIAASSTGSAFNDRLAHSSSIQDSNEAFGADFGDEHVLRAVRVPADEAAAFASWRPSRDPHATASALTQHTPDPVGVTLNAASLPRDPSKHGLLTSHILSPKPPATVSPAQLQSLHHSFVSNLRGPPPLSPRTKQAYQYFPKTDTDTDNEDDESNSSDDSEIEANGSTSRYAGTVHRALSFKRGIADIPTGLDHSDDETVERQQSSIRRGLRDRLPTLKDVADQPVVSLPEIRNTPSGKPYAVAIHGDGTQESAMGALIPDGWKVQDVDDFPGHSYICPVRTCQVVWPSLQSLGNHFRATHRRGIFNDNCDGTLSLLGRGPNVHHFSCRVVSQSRLPEGAPPSAPHSLVGGSDSKRKRQETRKIKREQASLSTRSLLVSDISTKMPAPCETSEALQHPNMSSAEKPQGHIRDTTPLSAESNIQDFLSNLKPRKPMQSSWQDVFQNATLQERVALTQLNSLPKRNEPDEVWASGIRRCNQRAYKVLLSLTLQTVGVKPTHVCDGCMARAQEKKNNCVVLPPEAKFMKELQSVIGGRCVNCFFFSNTKPCKLEGQPVTGQSMAGKNGLQIEPLAAKIVTVSSESTQSSQPAHTHAFDPIPSAASAMSNPMPSSTSVSKMGPPSTRPISQTPIPVPSIPVHCPTQQIDAARLAPATHGQPRDEGPNSMRRSGRLSTHISGSRKSSAIDDHDRRAAVMNANRGTSSASNSPSDFAAQASIPTSTASSATSSSPSLHASAVTHPTVSSVLSKAFGIFADVNQLPVVEQAGTWQKISDLLSVARQPVTIVEYQAQSTVLVAEDWEIAPGRLTSDSPEEKTNVAFSTSYLRREVVSLHQAPHISRLQRALNKHMQPLDVIKVEKFDDSWECTVDVMEGLVKVKTQGLEAKIGQGGTFIVRPDTECIITNFSHQVSRLKVRWVKQY